MKTQCMPVERKANCIKCNAPIICANRHKADGKYFLSLDALRRGTPYCSETCRDAGYSLSISIRMSNRNPMRLKKVREKQRTSLRALGWTGSFRGGNGQPLPSHQVAFAAALGWQTELAIKTLQKKGSGYPPCYKVDIGNAVLKIGVEVDGVSHSLKERQAQDRKKEALLATLGWKVIRFTNQEVLSDLQKCVDAVLCL